MELYTSCQAAIQSCLKTRTFSIAHLYKDEKVMQMHIHDCYEIFFSISGGKQFLIDNQFYSIQSGDLFIINQYESHHLSQIDQSVLERIVISIHPDYIEQLSTNQTNLASCFVEHNTHYCHKISLSEESQKQYLFFINKIISCSGYGSDLLETSAFIELLVFVNQLYQKQVQTEPEKSTNLYYGQVSQIISFIHQHINEPITISYLAKHFYLSESYLCRIFKHSTGTTINKYITAHRISMAKSMLASGATVSSVCEMCGFRDYSNFLKSFTKIVGLSPKKYAQCSIRSNFFHIKNT